MNIRLKGKVKSTEIAGSLINTIRLDWKMDRMLFLTGIVQST